MNTRPLLQGAGKALLDLLLPPRCSACSVLLQEELPFCDLCWQSVHKVRECCYRCGLPGSEGLCPTCKEAPPPWIRARAPLVYGGQAAVAVQRFKYQGMSSLSRPLGPLMRGMIPALGQQDMVVPVPLHPRRLRRRGYNQAALLARQAAQGTGLVLCFSALVRSRDTASQASLGRRLRLRNLRRAFAADRARVRGLRILLVDDVLTTGATARACSEALLDAGARSVSVLTLTRQP